MELRMAIEGLTDFLTLFCLCEQQDYSIYFTMTYKQSLGNTQ